MTPALILGLVTFGYTLLIALIGLAWRVGSKLADLQATIKLKFEATDKHEAESDRDIRELQRAVWGAEKRPVVAAVSDR